MKRKGILITFILISLGIYSQNTLYDYSGNLPGNLPSEQTLEEIYSDYGEPEWRAKPGGDGPSLGEIPVDVGGNTEPVNILLIALVYAAILVFKKKSTLTNRIN